MGPSLRRSGRATQTAAKSQASGSASRSIKSQKSTKPRRTEVSEVKENSEVSSGDNQGDNGKPPKSEEVDRKGDDDKLAARKLQAWSASATSSPYPNFKHPTPRECQVAHDVLTPMHQAEVDKEFADPDTPETIPHVLDAMIVGLLSQATGWSNAKRAMASMRKVYGSVFAYDDIIAGGMDKLRDALQPGGLHVRKSGLIMGILEQVRKEHPDWNLDHLFEMDDQEAMQELIKYKGIGPKSASVVMTWCLKRKSFTVDTHVYRVAGLWGWRPKDATREKTQAYLDAVIPNELKFDLHFLFIAHGRTCPACKGGAKAGQKCTAREEMEQKLQQ
ncbi:base excision DNA repair protein [Filobasidium floriforme]|uniref:base excision DNA repair protein n=1 Tax=Filobasidium floriforme TaxID=5210 RepID=UPI001E8CD916|nr:base excision DNA repair protein [Filobasidium floriforme]KAH8081448.1 base excision DNA repair protein [Filobasidium floriforme]